MNATSGKRPRPGEVFLGLLERVGLDQVTLARRSGLAPSTVSRIAQGNQPTMRTMDAMAPHLNVTVAELVDVFRTGAAPAAPPIEDPVRAILRDLANQSIPLAQREFLVDMLGVTHQQWRTARQQWGGARRPARKSGRS